MVSESKVLADNAAVGPVSKEPYQRLAEINRAITSSLNFDHVLKLIVENAAYLVDARVSLLLLANEQGDLSIRAFHGLDDHLSHSFSARLDEDISAKLRKLFALSPGDTISSVPIGAAASVDGLLVIARTRPISEEEEWQLSALADQAAIALRNARLYQMELAEANRGRRETLQALRSSRARINRILESITDIFYCLDREWRFTDVNKQAEVRLGKTRDQLIGKVIWEVFPGTVGSPLHEQLFKAAQKNVPVHVELVSDLIPAAWFEAHIYPSQSGLSVYLRDITERKAGEAGRRLLASIVESSDDAIISKDLDGIINSWNKGAERLFGYTAEEVIGRPVTILIPDGLFDEEPAILAQIRSGRSVEHYETVRKTKNGTLLDIWLSVSPIKDEFGKIIGASNISRNITDRKRAQEEIRFQASLLSAVEQAVIATDLDGTIIYWNTFAERLYGWTAREVLGANVIDLIARSSAKERAEEIIRNLREGRSWSGEILVHRRDGTEFYVTMTNSPILSNRGDLTGIVGVSTDITEAKRAEKERAALLESERAAREEAEAANRLKDEFLATLSHELRNPLNVVIGYSEILRRSEDSNTSFVSKAAEVIRRNALAQSQLVSDLLDLSRLQMGKLAISWQPVSLSTIITDAIETVRMEAEGKNISLSLETGKETLSVDGDPVRLGQIAWNLLNNAVKFTPGGGQIKISLTRESGNARLVVEDTGQGIAPEFLPCVFEIFRQADASSSRRQSGLGIGLALVKQLVELHGGHVQAESKGVGQGARFSVWLPLRERVISTTAAENNTSAAGLDHKLILVVDDSRETTDMLSRLLQMEGAFVQTARSGEEALALAAGNNFDLIISDISMPEMDGYQLLQRLRELPTMNDVPALALTGFGRVADVERARQEGFADHLTKPVDIERLIRVVKTLTQASGNDGTRQDAPTH